VLRLDHLAVVAADLETGVAAVESALGVRLAPGGQHPHMGTHNRLLNLGQAYLEVIARDPSLPSPGHARWFSMDRFTGPPRLTNWICATDDLDSALREAPEGAGVATPLSRGDFRWRISIPSSGTLPFDDAFPALIQWDGSAHPALRLPDVGVRLTGLTLIHPEADTLRAWLSPRLPDHRVAVEMGPVKAMRATFSTPVGPRFLQG
jgi:Glyoxalase-like domain